MSDGEGLLINRGVKDPELRFLRGTEWGPPPEYRPELGPCLIYVGADNGNGYGQFRYNGRNDYAHRYAWEREHGDIPHGLVVDHLCRVRRCVNAAHLELVDGPENTRRGAAARPKRTHCDQGHDLEAVGRRGAECRECARARDRERHRKLRKSPPGEDVRFVYDKTLRDFLVIEATERRITVRGAAERLGCTVKYMDKLVRREARRRGIQNRRHE